MLVREGIITASQIVSTDSVSEVIFTIFQTEIVI